MLLARSGLHNASVSSAVLTSTACRAAERSDRSNPDGRVRRCDHDGAKWPTRARSLGRARDDTTTTSRSLAISGSRAFHRSVRTGRARVLRGRPSHRTGRRQPHRRSAACSTGAADQGYGDPHGSRRLRRFQAMVERGGSGDKPTRSTNHYRALLSPGVGRPAASRPGDQTRRRTARLKTRPLHERHRRVERLREVGAKGELAACERSLETADRSVAPGSAQDAMEGRLRRTYAIDLFFLVLVALSIVGGSSQRGRGPCDHEHDRQDSHPAVAGRATIAGQAFRPMPSKPVGAGVTRCP